ncbi:MAG TPA: phage holin family protein [Kofleriaceae bacterium]|nr:phage holin family protein [Kofleriaceae bacterium]
MDTRQESPEVQTSVAEKEQGRIGELLSRINDDVKTIARDEVELARVELKQSMRSATADAAVLVLGGIVALIGLGLLCVSLVDAIEPLIEPLWLRLLLVAILYLVLGGAAAAFFASRLKEDLPPEMNRTKTEARRTARTIQEELRNARHH